MINYYKVHKLAEKIKRLGMEDAVYAEVRRRQLAKGGNIHIDKSKRGTFTAAAKRHDMGVQEFASRVLANRDDYSPAMVRKANFARNAASWNHACGGPLFFWDGGVVNRYDGETESTGRIQRTQPHDYHVPLMNLNFDSSGYPSLRTGEIVAVPEHDVSKPTVAQLEALDSTRNALAADGKRGAQTYKAAR